MARAIATTIRRFVHDPHECEELCQATLVRVTAATPQLTQDEMVAYAVVAARNAVRTHRRDAQARLDKHLRLAGRADITHDDDGGAPSIREIDALRVALQQLGPADRQLVHDVDIAEHHLREAATRLGIRESTARMRLLRARGRLRVRYLLAVLGLSPVDGRCVAVLDVLSYNDRTRARALDAERHVHSCSVCRRVAHELAQRRRPVLVVLLGAPLAGAWRWMRLHPLPTAGAAVATAATVTGAALVVTAGPPSPAPAATVTTLPAPLRLAASGASLAPAPDGLGSSAGQQVDATEVVVVEVVGDEALWIGDPAGPLLLVLTGGESAPTITAGQRLSFTGATLVATSPSQVAQFATDPAAATALIRQGAHVELPAGQVQVNA